jgi:hypothetical protein
MKSEQGEGVLGQSPVGQGGDPEALAAVVRIAVAVEQIVQTLSKRPAPSRRHAALVELLGEAPRLARTSPPLSSEPAPAPPPPAQLPPAAK